MNKKTAVNSRALAAQILTDVLHERQSLTDALESHVAKNILTPSEKASVQAICYGVMRYFFTLEQIKNHFLKKTLKKSARIVDVLLLIGFFQLLYSQTPAYAAVSETIKAADILKRGWAKNMLNGILREFLRQKEALEPIINETIESQTAHPEWLISRLQTHYQDKWLDILHYNQLPPPMTLRINVQKTSRDAYLSLLAAASIAAERCLESPEGIRLLQPVSVQDLPQFSEGFVSVQDESGQLLPAYLDLQPKQKILDACCAPGSKFCHLLERYPECEFWGVDINPKRLETVKANLERLQLNRNDNVHLIEADSSVDKNWSGGILFDRILLDAPCSATGVIRRHPDIKYLRQASDINQLRNQQLTLLKSLWKKLRPKGKLVYSTCSILAEENELVIQNFLSNTPNADLAEPSRQILPGENNMDGFFYAVLSKVAT